MSETKSTQVPKDHAYEDKLERVARLYCEACGIEPDELRYYDEGGGSLVARSRPAWISYAEKLRKEHKLARFVRMLDE